MDIYIDISTKRQDPRGFLVDFLKADEVDEQDKFLGQIYFVTFNGKGIVRGNHYHTTKKEWFVPVKGSIQVFLKDIITGEITNLVIDGDSHEYQRIRIGANIAHAFVSLSPEAAMINYSNKPYTATHPDTISHQLV